MPSDHLPTDLEDVRGIVEASSEPSFVSSESLSEESEQTIRERETEREGRAEYFRLRNHWSAYLFLLLLLSLLFQFGTAILIGFGRLDFAEYKEFLYLVSGENFLQIVGMVFIVVRFLFPSAEKDAGVAPKKQKPKQVPPQDPPPIDDLDLTGHDLE